RAAASLAGVAGGIGCTAGGHRMERLDMLFEPVKAALLQVAHFLPKLAVALVVLVIGWVLARVMRFVVVKGMRAANFPVLAERAGFDSALRMSGMGTDATAILG